jgi:hypothetical protein
MTGDTNESDSCDRCGKSADDGDLETTLSGDTLCSDCRDHKRENAGTREAGQAGFDSFEGDDDGR